MSVSSEALARWVGVSELSVGPVKGAVVSVSCTTGVLLRKNVKAERAPFHQLPISSFVTFTSKTDHDVSVALVQLLKGQRGDSGPDVQRLADGFVHSRLLQVRRVI